MNYIDRIVSRWSCFLYGSIPPLGQLVPSKNFFVFFVSLLFFQQMLQTLIFFILKCLLFLSLIIHFCFTLMQQFLREIQVILTHLDAISLFVIHYCLHTYQYQRCNLATCPVITSHYDSQTILPFTIHYLLIVRHHAWPTRALAHVLVTSSLNHYFHESV